VKHVQPNCRRRVPLKLDTQAKRLALVFTEQEEITTITQTVLYESREARDGVLKSGRESGVAASYNCLSALAALTQNYQATPLE